ncbi:MAG: DNA adenine methylase [Acidobacteria bacterium]|nr:DNA adenine methylase [Acidobacteriota bacterium]
MPVQTSLSHPAAHSPRGGGPARPAGRPLLKWAGGKRQLLPLLRRCYPADFDRYTDPRICDAEHVRAVAHALAAGRVALECAPFEETLAQARAGDFVYCDPPYAPLSRTARFAHYTADGFDAGDHEWLRAAVVAAAGRGAVVLM